MLGVLLELSIHEVLNSGFWVVASLIGCPWHCGGCQGPACEGGSKGCKKEPLEKLGLGTKKNGMVLKV